MAAAPLRARAGDQDEAGRALQARHGEQVLVSGQGSASRGLASGRVSGRRTGESQGCTQRAGSRDPCRTRFEQRRAEGPAWTAARTERLWGSAMLR